MRKVIVSALAVLIVSSAAVAQDFWHIKVAAGAMIASPSDGNGVGFGPGASVIFGYPHGNFDMGFEVRKWSRSYDIFDSLMNALSDRGQIRIGGSANPTQIIHQSQSHHEDSGLSFAVNMRYKFYDITPNIGVYAGGGIGVYLIQVRRDESRQNNHTGYWQIEFVDYYLETKAQENIFLGVEGPITNKIDYFVEGRTAIINSWDRWDHPYVLDGNLGLRFSF
jgi:hypothetical protein